MQIRLDPVHPDFGDGAARRDDILEQHKGRRHAQRFDCGAKIGANRHLISVESGR